MIIIIIDDVDFDDSNDCDDDKTALYKCHRIRRKP